MSLPLRLALSLKTDMVVNSYYVSHLAALISAEQFIRHRAGDVVTSFDMFSLVQLKFSIPCYRLWSTFAKSRRIWASSTVIIDPNVLTKVNLVTITNSCMECIH